MASVTLDTIGGFNVEKEDKAIVVTKTVKVEVATFELSEEKVEQAVREFIMRHMTTDENIRWPHIDVALWGCNDESVSTTVTLSKEPLT